MSGEVAAGVGSLTISGASLLGFVVSMWEEGRRIYTHIKEEGLTHASLPTCPPTDTDKADGGAALASSSSSSTNGESGGNQGTGVSVCASPGCDKAAAMACPKCIELKRAPTLFCSQASKHASKQTDRQRQADVDANRRCLD